MPRDFKAGKFCVFEEVVRDNIDGVKEYPRLFVLNQALTFDEAYDVMRALEAWHELRLKESRDRNFVNRREHD